MQTFISIALGIGLAAACGFRVFVPLLVTSAAAHTGYLTLSSGLDWIGSTPALIVFAVATVLEIAGYYVPWIDHVLDAVAAPAAVAAGTLLAASVITDVSPLLKWSLALIGGGTAAAAVHGATAGLRGLSTLATGGLGNPVVATAEAAGATVLSILAVVVPLLALAAVVLLAVLAWRWLRRRRRPDRPATVPT